MMYSEARYRFVVLDPVDQMAYVALVRCFLKVGGVDHVHGPPSVHEPFTGGFRWMQYLGR